MISIVMAYYNRLKLLENTLKRIEASVVKDVEIIVVDDFSDVDHDPSPLIEKYAHLKVKLIKMADIDKKKKYINPCIPYNVGFKYVSGDKVIIQNPECIHYGDVIHFVQNNCNNSNYFSFNCYALSELDTIKFNQSGEVVFHDSKSDYTNSGWYNHHIYNPNGWHFTSCITTENLKKLNGFDERFAYGYGFDDMEFLHRIKLLNLNISLVYSPIVIHQYHGKTEKTPPPYRRINDPLFYDMTLKENKTHATHNRNML